MSKPDLVQEIIKSPEAKRFLGMVTKDFYNDSYTGLWIYEVIGREWDEMRSWVEGYKKEINPQTCTWSISIWEWVYGFEPDDSLPLEFRRQRLLSHIRVARPINPEVLRRAVVAFVGGNDTSVEVTDFTGPYRFEVVIHPQEAPFFYSRVGKFIWDIKPSHLAFDTVIETKLIIQVLIGEEAYLYGNGLTGMYPSGTRPDIQTHAVLPDTLIEVPTTETPFHITPERAGTVYAATQTQRMNPPSTHGRLEDPLVDVLGDGAGHQAFAPWTDGDETGQYPSTSTKVMLEDRNINAETAGQAYKHRYEHAGTIPDIQHKFQGEESDITVPSTDEEFKYTADNAGTKPYPDKKGSVDSIGISAGTVGAGYKSNSPGINDTPAGIIPGVQEYFREEQTGITATPDGAGYQVPIGEPSGTNPIPAIQFTERDTGIQTGAKLEEYKYISPKVDKEPVGADPVQVQFMERESDVVTTATADRNATTPPDITGTTPGVAEKFSDAPVNINTGTESDAHTASRPDIAGSRPDTAVKTEKPIGGVSPVVEGESYEVQYPMCGTGMTKK